eukprot:TRINITY_DN9994_c0_g1_i1.p1 TRINITY_DN9994_c0_g1~~TRINITY_DN9994_c0_g1_i1.p1  ORF type:complete len:430 (+),score=77.75 TRINITY_DN9994_c0_g1_i1:77-1291(+)
MELLPWIRELVDHVNYPTGCAWRNVRQSCSQDGGGEHCGDRVQCVVPYCLGYVCWELIFDARHPDHPPDVIFVDNEADDRTQTSPAKHTDWFDPGKLKTFARWQSGQAHMLRDLVSDLIDQFRAFQETLVARHPNQRVTYEYETLSGGADQGRKGIEWCLPLAGSDLVRIRIPLFVNFGGLVQLWQERRARQQLPVQSCRDDGCWISCELSAEGGRTHFISFDVVFPDIVNQMNHRWLTDRAAHQVPPADQALVDYVTALETNMQTTIDMYVHQEAKRRDIIKTLQQKFLGQPLQYDELDCKSASFLYNSDNPDKHPSVLVRLSSLDRIALQEVPAITLMSTHHFQRQRGRAEPITQRSSVPAPPQHKQPHLASAQAWAETIFHCIQSRRQKFQQYCADRPDTA